MDSQEIRIGMLLIKLDYQCMKAHHFSEIEPAAGGVAIGFEPEQVEAVEGEDEDQPVDAGEPANRRVFEAERQRRAQIVDSLVVGLAIHNHIWSVSVCQCTAYTVHTLYIKLNLVFIEIFS